MKLISLFFALAFSAVAFAHADHNSKIADCAGTCTQAEVEKSLSKVIGSLILRGKIGPEWAELKPEKVYQKQFARNLEWVAEIYNKDQKLESQRRLYIFVTMDGRLSGANYTGK